MGGVNSTKTCTKKTSLLVELIPIIKQLMIFLNFINQLVFIIHTQSISLEVGDECLILMIKIKLGNLKDRATVIFRPLC
jgi:hypothetical protein